MNVALTSCLGPRLIEFALVKVHLKEATIHTDPLKYTLFHIFQCRIDSTWHLVDCITPPYRNSTEGLIEIRR
uniref:Uncharacterized protein n=1 Tax=viral metagenome TaxID=1070528 RepID=A0A6C0DSD1_9ZZZZ